MREMKILLLSIAVLGVHPLWGQGVETVSLDQLIDRIETPSDHVMVYNFWATWCVPCLAEMPMLDNINAAREDIEVIFISMDMDTDSNPEKVYRFLERRTLASDVLILNETNSSKWIKKIERKWSGTLPATIISQKGKRAFIEKQLKEGELERWIDN